MGESASISRDYAMAKAADLRAIAKDMDGHANYPMHNGDAKESIAQRLRQAAFVIEMTAPLPEPPK